MKKRKFFNRYTALIVMVAVLFSVLTTRLYNVQIVNGDEARAKAEATTIKDISEPAPRGDILDKEGEVLATSTASYTLLYNENTTSSPKFYTIMKDVFQLLDQTKETLVDEFPLKVDPYRFEFNVEENFKQAREAVFKNERGFSEYLLEGDLGKQLGKKQVTDLSKEERSVLDKELVKISPEDSFRFLIKEYKIYKILGLSDEENKKLAALSYKEVSDKVLEKFSPSEIRKYMLVRDSVRAKIYQTTKSVDLATNLKKESAFVFMQKASVLEGVSVMVEPERIYPYGDLASHVLGYLAPINEYNKSKFEGKGYDVNEDYVGAYGIESSYEDVLKGNKTVKTVKVDKQGRAVSTMFELEGYPGSTVQLSIDKDLQYVAERALADTLKNLQTENRKHLAGDSGNATRGGVVVINIKTGKILALASNPSFDPNLFAVPGRITPDLYKKYFAPDYLEYGKKVIANMNLQGVKPEDMFPVDSNGNRYDKYDLYPKPFLNYATQGLSPVGSIFKPFTSLAGLEDGVIDENTRVNDIGYYQRPELPGYKADNDSRTPHGIIGLLDALKVSSNFFFLETGYRLYQSKGLNAIAEWAWKLGLGNDPKEGVHSNTGIEINENVYGNVFNFENRKKIIGLYAYDELARVMNRGVTREGKPMPKVDISMKDSDSSKVKEAKQNINNALKKFWSSIQIGDKKGPTERMNEIVDAIDYNLNSLLETIPEQERKTLKSSTDYAMEYAKDAIYDRYQELMTPVNVMNSAIGQGDAQLTTLQIVNALATIVNGGTRYRTSVVDKILDADGKVTKVIEPEILQKLDIDPKNIDLIKKGMYKVNHENGGSGYPYFGNFPIKTGGKTGTAEYLTGKQGIYGRTTYGTYITFAPYDDPEIAIASIVYDSVHGSFTAPISRAIYEEYFKDTIKKNFPDYKFKSEYTLKPVINVSESLLKLKNPLPKDDKTTTKPDGTKENSEGNSTNKQNEGSSSSNPNSNSSNNSNSSEDKKKPNETP